MKELVVATSNRGKYSEFEHLLRSKVESIYSLADFPGIPPVVEDGATFEENAKKKAHATAIFTGKPAIADDSGLMVDALGGRPGVHSARFAGEGASDADNNTKLLELLSIIPAETRVAAFCCVIAYCLPDGHCLTFTGELKGTILFEGRGSCGFGYDPLFLVPEYGKTLAELPLEVKNRISHRGIALKRFFEYLKR